MKRIITIEKPGDYIFSLEEVGSEIDIRGAFSLSGHDNFELNITIIHNAPHTIARTQLRAVVDGQAIANLTGKIIVNQPAVGTNSFLRENILLLSAKAKATAIPNLEILCDDVVCSHAATVGKIDPDQVFYLMSRGLSEKTAKAMIARGFLLL